MPNYNLTVANADIYLGYLKSRATDGLDEVKEVIRDISCDDVRDVYFY